MLDAIIPVVFFALSGFLWGNWWLMGFDFAITSLGVALAGSQAFKFNDSREEAFVGSLVAFCKVW